MTITDADSNHKMPTYLKGNTVIVFSESFDGRDYLRTLVNKTGSSAICFEKEASCIDNFKSISPKIVIAQTDSKQVVRRFIFAISSMGLDCPLMVLSDMVIADDFENSGIRLPFYSIVKTGQDSSLSMKISEIVKRNEQRHGNQTHPSLLLGEAESIREIRNMLPSIAGSMDPVLITGEKGTGKELLVRLIGGDFRDENYLIKFECSQLYPEILLSNWIEKIMSFEASDKPITILLNGIHLISKDIQAEILMFMDTVESWKSRERAGALTNIRFTATSEVMIEELVKKDAFRKDLFYRLNVIPVHMPALRDHREDIALLMDYFIITAGASNKKSTIIPSQMARDTLYFYDWPGNVMELKIYMQRVSATGSEACIHSNNKLPKIKKDVRELFLKYAGMADLPKSHEIKNSLPSLNDLSLKNICEEFVARTEKRLMQKALEATNWNRKKAATLLKISYKSLLNKIKTYELC